MLKQVVLPLDFFMKILIFLLIFVISITLVGESYAQRQAHSQEDPTSLEIT